MAIQGFLKIPGIPGASVRDGHEDEIEFHGIEFGMAAAQAPGGGGVGAARVGRVTLEPIRVVKHYDVSSPALKQVLFRGGHVREAVFAMTRTVDGDTSDYLVVTLTDASVIGYDLRPAPEPDLLEESITFTYRSVSFVYDGTHEVELEGRRAR
ncbi:Hcp family type VI secretion system effector [Occultella kanbiaonis]|uniref:Hcp family type VI secretion system effector n=1 Tax=Occultella kanbiaonis TaxID=2675754 RepID=UPI0013D65116|nr:type VI secretion system tube protein Hcp [Occultella kanbiaonis]